MAEKNKKEVSFTQGPIFGSIVRFALPVLGALVLQAAYGAVDLLVVGQFGDAASISAVGTGSAFMQMVTFILTSLAMGSTIIIAQHIGEKRPKAAGDAVGTTIVLFLIIGIALTVILEIFAGNIAEIMQVPAQAYTKTVTYIRICSGGILVIIAYNVISGILRGVGNANLPFLFVGIACVVNIAGDLLLVGVFKMDVAGAAIATIAAQAVSVVISVLVLKKQELPIAFSKVPHIFNRVWEDIEGRSANCSSGNDGSDILPCHQFDHQPYGPDAVSRIWRGAKDRVIHHAGSFLRYAERFSLRGAECRSRKSGEGQKRIPNCDGIWMRGGNLDLSGWLFWRRISVSAFYLRWRGYYAKRQLPERIFSGLHPDLYIIQQHRIF